MKKLSALCLCFLLLFLTGCSTTNSHIYVAKPLERKEWSYDYNLYCLKYPSFRNYRLENYDLYWTVDKTVGVDTKAAAIHCSNDTEAFYLFQVGNMFCKFDYADYYMGVSNCTSLRIGGKMYYAFTMCRFFSTGGFYIEDLLLFEPGETPKVYVLTIEDAFDAVSAKVTCAYDRSQNKALIQDSYQMYAVSVDRAETLSDGSDVQKEVRDIELYARLEHFNEEENKYCWGYSDIQDNKISLTIVVFANFYEAPNYFLHYRERYSFLGKVSVPVTFENGEFMLGDAEFEPYEG